MAKRKIIEIEYNNKEKKKNIEGIPYIFVGGMSFGFSFNNMMYLGLYDNIFLEAIKSSMIEVFISMVLFSIFASIMLSIGIKKQNNQNDKQ